MVVYGHETLAYGGTHGNNRIEIKIQLPPSLHAHT